MAQGHKRRNSMDVWGDFEIFISEFDENSPRMYEIVDNLNQIWTKIRPKPRIRRNSAQVFPQTEIVLLLFIGYFMTDLPNFIRDLELDDYMRVIVAVASYAVFLYLELPSELRLKKAKKLVSEFLELAERLRVQLPAVRDSFQKQDRDVEVLVQIEAKINELFDSGHVFISEPTEQRLLVVSEQCKKTMGKIEQFRFEEESIFY